MDVIHKLPFPLASEIRLWKHWQEIRGRNEGEVIVFLSSAPFPFNSFATQREFSPDTDLAETLISDFFSLHNCKK